MSALDECVVEVLHGPAWKDVDHESGEGPIANKYNDCYGDRFNFGTGLEQSSHEHDNRALHELQRSWPEFLGGAKGLVVVSLTAPLYGEGLSVLD